MLKRRLQAVFVPATTFIIGILVQSLFDQWITNKNIILLSLTVLFFSLVVILLFLAHLSTQSSNIDAKLSDLIEHSSLNMRYIEDDIDGQSYREATKLLEDIQHHLIVVGNWELFPDYRVNNTSVNTGESSAIQARRRFYEVLNRKIEAHQNAKEPFYRRVIQVPEEYVKNRAPFETDPVFFHHLLFVAKLIADKHASCIIRKTSHFINIQFTIIDDKHIIIPILTTQKNLLQARYGALIIKDTSQELVQRLKTIYWSLESNAHTVDIYQLDPPKNHHIQ